MYAEGIGVLNEREGREVIVGLGLHGCCTPSRTNGEIPPFKGKGKLRSAPGTEDNAQEEGGRHSNLSLLFHTPETFFLNDDTARKHIPAEFPFDPRRYIEEVVEKPIPVAPMAVEDVEKALVVTKLRRVFMVRRAPVVPVAEPA